MLSWRHFLWWVYSVLPYIFFISFNLNSNLSDTKIAISTCVLGPFAWIIFFNPLPWDNIYPWSWGVILSWSRRMNNVCIHSVALYLLLGELRPLTFRYINNKLHFYYFFCCYLWWWWWCVSMCVCASLPLILLVWDFFVYSVSFLYGTGQFREKSQSPTMLFVNLDVVGFKA